jgi:hypothetical protein
MFMNHLRIDAKKAAEAQRDGRRNALTAVPKPGGSGCGDMERFEAPAA